MDRRITERADLRRPLRTSGIAFLRGSLVEMLVREVFDSIQKKERRSETWFTERNQIEQKSLVDGQIEERIDPLKILIARNDLDEDRVWVVPVLQAIL